MRSQAAQNVRALHAAKTGASNEAIYVPRGLQLMALNDASARCRKCRRSCIGGWKHLARVRR